MIYRQVVSECRGVPLSSVSVSVLGQVNSEVSHYRICAPVLRLCSIRFVLVLFALSSGYVRSGFFVLFLFLFLFFVSFALSSGYVRSGLFLFRLRCPPAMSDPVCSCFVCVVLRLCVRSGLFLFRLRCRWRSTVVVGAVVHCVGPCLSSLALLRAAP